MRDISREIIERAARADLSAFETIYSAASGFVYNVALRVTNNSHDAQEVTQDVFMKIYDNLKHFQHRSSFKTWIYRITVNTAINAYNKGSRDIENRVDLETVIKTKESSERSETAAINDEQERILYDLLGRLNPNQRACIILREIEGLSYEEISAALKINLNTVRSRLKRGRENLILFAKSLSL